MGQVHPLPTQFYWANAPLPYFQKGRGKRGEKGEREKGGGVVGKERVKLTKKVTFKILSCCVCFLNYDFRYCQKTFAMSLILGHFCLKIVGPQARPPQIQHRGGL